MATIELSMELYNNMEAKIKELEAKNGKLNKIIEEKNDHIEKLESTIATFEDASVYDRTVGWKKFLAFNLENG